MQVSSVTKPLADKDVLKLGSVATGDYSMSHIFPVNAQQAINLRVTGTHFSFDISI